MPVIKSAIKKERQDKKRTAANKVRLEIVKRLIKKAKTSKKSIDIKKAISLIDKMVKIGLYHKNKASRLKSKLGKLISKSTLQKK